MPDQLADHRHVGGGQPDRGRDRRGDRGAGRTVVAGQALADVVQEGGQHEQVGAGHLAGVRGGLGGGLDQVPVDGVEVHRVVLGQPAQPYPLGQPPDRSARTGRTPPIPGSAPGPAPSSVSSASRDTARHGSGSGGQNAASHSQGRPGDG